MIHKRGVLSYPWLRLLRGEVKIARWHDKRRTRKTGNSEVAGLDIHTDDDNDDNGD